MSGFFERIICREICAEQGRSVVSGGTPSVRGYPPVSGGTHSSFSDSSGIKKSAFFKILTRIDIIRTFHGAVQSPNILRHSNTVLLFVLRNYMISLSKKNTVLPRAQINFLLHGNFLLLFVLSSHMISLTNKFCYDVESVFGFNWRFY